MIRNEVCSFNLGDLIVALNITTKERSNYTEFVFAFDFMQIKFSVGFPPGFF